MTEEATKPVESRQFGAKRLDFPAGGGKGFVILPETSAGDGPMPWIWYAPTLIGQHPDESHAWMFRQLLDKGFAIAGVDVGESFGNPEGRRTYTAFYELAVPRYGLVAKACFMPQSRGGLMLYNWAAENPQRVQCIAGIYTVCDLSSWPGLEKACSAYAMSEDELLACLAQHNPVERLAPLAAAGIPILHVHGDADTVVPIERNSGELARRYKALGGSMRLIVVPGKGHEVCDEFFRRPEVVDFLLSQR